MGGGTANVAGTDDLKTRNKDQEYHIENQSYGLTQLRHSEHKDGTKLDEPEIEHYQDGATHLWY